MSATQLHAILAIEGDKLTAAKKVLEETTAVFDKKPDHFFGFEKRYDAFDPNDPTNGVSETKQLVTTVPAKLSHCLGILGEAIDVSAIKDATNQIAKAPIILRGKQITEDLPATTLLMLESRIAQWLNLFLAIPTLPPGREWKLSSTKGDGIYDDAHPEKTPKTKKTTEYVTVAPATDKHPAQVRDWAVDVPIGYHTKATWSGMMSPADKSDLIARTQELITAVKMARQAANGTPIVQINPAATLIKFVLGGELCSDHSPS